MVAVVILGAGFGTRLAKDLAAAAASGEPPMAPGVEWSTLQTLPKPLLPVWAGRPLLDEWLDALLDCRARGIAVGPIVVVTNEQFHGLFAAWAVGHGIDAQFVLNDGARTNETRLGAIADLQLALTTFAGQIGTSDVLVLAGDTLFYDSFHLASFIEEAQKGAKASGDHILYYRVQGDAEVSKRGIVEIDPVTSKVTGFLEKPQPTETSSRWASPAFYLFRNSTLALIHQYVAENKSSQALLDAPGQLVSWLHKKTNVYGTQIEGRFDIGGLADYKVAFDANVVVERSFARIGLIGNPSDGFNGKTISVAVRNFFATIRLKPSTHLVIAPNTRYDSTTFASLQDLQDRTSVFGYYGGVRLLRAIAKRFFDLVQKHAPELVSTVLAKNFTMTYDSNIPFAVGLAGSSAIVTAALRSLFKFYGVTLEALQLPRDQLPNVVLSIEKEELGINAGLQDRVIQEYEGAVHMDFSKDIVSGNKGAGKYTAIRIEDLPPLYLAYMVKAGGDSGKIHSDVRRRWESGEQAVVDAMNEFARITDVVGEAIAKHDYAQLGQQMDYNFDLRRTIYGDAVTGHENIVFVEVARSLGFHAKFTGSGGAFVLVSKSATALSAEDEVAVCDRLAKIGFAFTRVAVQAHGQPLNLVMM